ncbi:hypothetical protein L208DRAFT_1088064, partial [Tricholoma matsutake]
YGEKGKAIIYDTLRRIFPADQTRINKIVLLTLILFIEYILIPHVSVTLISRNLDITTDEAYQVMIASASYGEMMYP